METESAVSIESTGTNRPPGSWEQMTDEDLLCALRNGGLSRGDAVEVLFRRHQARLERWCYRFMRNRESALDLAQETFLRAWRHLNNYRGDCRFSTWLYVIARNLCATAIQKRASEPVWIDNGIRAELPDAASANVYQAMEQTQWRLHQWRFILETLDRTEAQVLMLHYGEELSLQAVSRKLGLTNKSGAKAYIVSARRKLQKARGAAERS